MGLNFKESEDETVDQKYRHVVAHTFAIKYRFLAQVVYKKAQRVEK